jgi:uncharacterized protein YhaN
MLYGQKSDALQRTFEDSNQLRLPWNNPDSYGGSLLYELSNGSEIEVLRKFDSRDESVQIFDRSQARDITGDFERLRNHEVDFASAHLGLSKEVFLGTATINYFSLENLGDSDALMQIREKLLSLADTGNEANSADISLKRLKDRVSSIGSSGARSKPLPQVRRHLAELAGEHERVLALEGELETLAEKRRTIFAESTELRGHRHRTEESLRVLEAHERAERLHEAEALVSRIDTATQHCFALGAAREFPLAKVAEEANLEKVVANARLQRDRTRTEAAEIRKQLERECQELGTEQSQGFQELPEDLEKRFNDLNAQRQSLDERLSETSVLVEAAEKRLVEAQHVVSEFPEFSRLASDPVEWMTQLASSFKVAVQARNDEIARRTQLREEVDERQSSLEELELLFQGCSGFTELARDYELAKRVQEDQLVQRSSYVQSLRGTQEELQDKKPAWVWLSVVCALVLGGILAGAFLKDKPVLFIPAAVFALSLVFFLGNLIWGRVQLKRLARDLARTEEQLAGGRGNGDLGNQAEMIVHMMKQGNCQTIRELEALYDEYRMGSAELSARREVLNQLEQRADEAEAHTASLLAHLRSTFLELGEEIGDESEVAEAASRAIGRYQSYRESKRRVADSRSVLEKHGVEHKRLTKLSKKNNEDLQTAENELRALMRDGGFLDERHFDSLPEALRAHRKRQERLREQGARITLLQEKVHDIDCQIDREEFELKKGEEALGQLLSQACVSSVEQWHTMAAQAQEYQEIWRKRSTLEEQLKAVLHGEDLNVLRKTVDQGAWDQPAPAQSRDALKADIDTLSARIEVLEKEEHHLHIRLTERNASMRSRNEIEEDRTCAERQLHDLEREFEAATYAMALIEDIARDKHARIAPKLAASASHYLSEITDGSYDELLISRDLTISVRIPQTKHINEAPEKSLSKGTVDQVYFALRMALIQTMSEQGEPIPMLLDDPFANYDDARLARTLGLISTLSKENQILLFTCREDVVRAAEAIKIPIIRL